MPLSIAWRVSCGMSDLADGPHQTDGDADRESSALAGQHVDAGTSTRPCVDRFPRPHDLPTSKGTVRPVSLTGGLPTRIGLGTAPISSHRTAPHWWGPQDRDTAVRRRAGGGRRRRRVDRHGADVRLGTGRGDRRRGARPGSPSGPSCSRSAARCAPTTARSTPTTRRMPCVATSRAACAGSASSGSISCRCTTRIHRCRSRRRGARSTTSCGEGLVGAAGLSNHSRRPARPGARRRAGRHGAEPVLAASTGHRSPTARWSGASATA